MRGGRPSYVPQGQFLVCRGACSSHLYAVVANLIGLAYRNNAPVDLIRGSSCRMRIQTTKDLARLRVHDEYDKEVLG